MREKRTDERLDDMNGRMAEGFNRIDPMVIGFLSVITQL